MNAALLQRPAVAVTSELTDASAAPGLSYTLRCCIVFVFVSTTLLARFGINLGSHSLTFSSIAIYALLAAIVVSRRGTLDTTSLLFYGAGLLVAYLSWFTNTHLSPVDRSSQTSMLLLIVLYLPFVVTTRLSDLRRSDWRWTLEAFSNIALVCAVAGIAQFCAQFVVNPPWLFDFSEWIPEQLRAPGIFNTVISVGELHKSNGFFFREPSSFSFLMALAAVLELNSSRRWTRVGLFVFALLLTYSGTGLLALLLGLMFPLGGKTVLRLLGLAVVGGLLVTLLGDALNLSFTLNRVQEFGSQHSSAYIRYIAPMHVVAGSIDSAPWTALLGHGPGSIQRTAQTIQAFDPTWAKLIFEYGLLGFGAFVALIVHALVRSDVPPQLRAVLFFSWLIMGGHLLSADNISTLYVLACLWRPDISASLAAADRNLSPVVGSMSTGVRA